MAPPKTRSENPAVDFLTAIEDSREVHPAGALAAKRAEREKMRRAEALSLRLAGLALDQIADRLGVASTNAVEELVYRTLGEVREQGVDELRSLESARLDRAQAAIWTKVLEGDLKAVDVFLRLSTRRAKLFGMDAPTRIDLSVGVRAEMEHALAQLEQVVLGEVISVTDDVATG